MQQIFKHNLTLLRLNSKENEKRITLEQTDTLEKKVHETMECLIESDVLGKVEQNVYLNDELKHLMYLFHCNLVKQIIMFSNESRNHVLQSINLKKISFYD